jgi:hypothetical protein
VHVFHGSNLSWMSFLALLPVMPGVGKKLNVLIADYTAVHKIRIAAAD